MNQAIQSNSSMSTSETDLDNTNISPNDDDNHRENNQDLNPFKATGMPPALEEFIPPQYFPDVLLVKDSDQVAIAKSCSVPNADVRSTLAANWIKFNRVVSTPSSPDTDTGKYLRRNTTADGRLRVSDRRH